MDTALLKLELKGVAGSIQKAKKHLQCFSEHIMAVEAMDEGSEDDQNDDSDEDDSDLSKWVNFPLKPMC